MMGAVIPFRLEPKPSMQSDLRAVAQGRLDVAIEALSGLEGAHPDEIEEAVHSARKRCKEARGLARLIQPALGAEFGRFNGLVRDAAVELSTIRDAHAMLATFDELRSAADHTYTADLREVRSHQARTAKEATDSISAGDPRIVRALELLSEARSGIDDWEIPDGFEPIGGGLAKTYKRGKRALRKARRNPSEPTLHAWRKAVKNLWYQVRLVEAASPVVLVPFVASLDDLAESLGDDHDLAIIIERLLADPSRFGGGSKVERAVDLARRQQEDLRRRALRLGATLYTEPTGDFVRRIESYWNTTLEHGPELTTGGINVLAALDDEYGTKIQTVELARKFLVGSPPHLPSKGEVIRQGYLAIDGSVAVRVRKEGERSHTFTAKAGLGPVRTELEWPIDPRQFEAAWAITRDRHVHKTRYRTSIDEHVASVDVFHGDLDGLMIAEVEFDSLDRLNEFEPPEWFGTEVTNDERFANAALAVNGAPAPT